MAELPDQQSNFAQPTPAASPATQDPDFVQPEKLSERFSRHENRSGRAHLWLGLGLLLLAILLGRVFYENWMLRQGENELSAAVGEQALQLAQVGAVDPILGSGFVEPGTVLIGPDGKEYICVGTDGSAGADVTGPTGSGETGAAGTAGVAGSTGTTGVAGIAGSTGITGTAGGAGTAGSTGTTGATGSIGATGPAGPTGVSGATVNLDEAYNNFGVSAAAVNIDGTEGQGSLRFNLPAGADFVVQDNGVTFANFQANGDVTFVNNFGIGDAALNETLANAGFTVNGDDLYVSGQAGIEGTIFTDSGLIVGSSAEYTDTGITTTASTGDFTITTAAGGAGGGDLRLTAADDITLTAGGGDILNIGATNIAILGAADDAPLRLSNLASGEAANLYVGSLDPDASVVAGDDGSLFLRDAAGTGELWISDGGGSWRQIATTSGAASTNLDEAYNNFGALTPATIVVDNGESQGDLKINLSGAADDFIIQDGGVDFATFANTGVTTFSQSAIGDSVNIEKIGALDGTALTVTQDGTTGNHAIEVTQSVDGDGIAVASTVTGGASLRITRAHGGTGNSLIINHTPDSEAVTITQNGDDNPLHIIDTHASSDGVVIEQTNVGEVGFGLQVLTSTGGNAIQVNQGGAGRGMLINHDGTTNNVGLEILWDENELVPEASAPLYIFASSNDLIMSGDSVNERAGIIQVDTNSEDTDTFNFIAFNVGSNDLVPVQEAMWRVDSTGATFAEGAYSGAGADFAEYFNSADDSLEAGELVTLDPDLPNAVRRTRDNSNDPIGVISTNPAFVGNNIDGVAEDDQPANRVLVGLTGQVPLKVTNEGGNISIGDYLTSSSTPGHGKKAENGDAVVGVALENESGDGTVMVLLAQSPGGLSLQASLLATDINEDTESSIGLKPQGSYKDLRVLQNFVADHVSASQLEVSGLVKAGKLIVDQLATFSGGVVMDGHVTFGGDTVGEVTVPAGETQVNVVFDQDYSQVPHVLLTPQGILPVAYGITGRVVSGFRVEIAEPLDEDIVFSWMAVAEKDDSEIDSIESIDDDN